MTITRIKYFIEVAKQCNVRKTAEKLFITQQGLSKQIQALEKETGVQLFVRKNHHMHLTDAGALLLESWEPAVMMIDESLRKAKSLQGKDKIKIGIPDISELMESMMEYLQDNLDEAVEFEYVIDTVNNLLEHFRRKRVDIMLAFQTDLYGLKEAYSFDVIKRMPYGVICSRQHPIARLERVTIPQLAHEKICFFDSFYVKNMEQDIRSLFANHGLQPAEVRSYADWRNMEIALRMGTGVVMTFQAFMPQNTKSLVFVPIVDEADNSGHNLVVAWRDEKWEEMAKTFKKAFL